MQSRKIACLVLLGAFVFCGCKEEEVVEKNCYPAVVIDQGCGTVLGILDSAAASLVGTKPQNDTVYVNTFDLHPIYQVSGKKLYISIKPLSPEEGPKCPGFIPVIYPHIKVLGVSETSCD